MAYFDVMEYYLKKIRKMNYLRKYKEIVYVPNLYGVFQFFLLKNRLINNVFIFHDRFRDEFSAQFDSLNLINKSPLLCYLLIKWFSLWNRQAVIYLSGEMRYTNFFLKCFKNIVYLEDGVASYEKINDCPKKKINYKTPDIGENLSLVRYGITGKENISNRNSPCSGDCKRESRIDKSQTIMGTKNTKRTR